MCTYARAHLWRSEDKLQESVLSFGHVGPLDQILVISLDGSLLHLLSHLDGPLLYVHMCMRVQRWVEGCVCVCVCARRSIHRCLQEHVLVQSQHWVFLYHHLLYSLRQVSQKPQNPKPSELIETATLTGQLPQRSPVSPSGHCTAWVPEIQIQSSFMEPFLLSLFRTHVNVCRHCVCECPHTHVFHGTRGQPQAVFFETKILTYLELTN